MATTAVQRKSGSRDEKDAAKVAKVDAEAALGVQKKTRRATLAHWVKMLNTKEDPFKLHKILGFSALLSFAYRYGYVYPTTGTLGFDGSWFDWATMFLHMALSSTSLFFHVIRKRIKARPMIIYEEYRLHAILFTLRCLSVYSFGQFRHLLQLGDRMEQAVLATLVLSHHVVVDRVTAAYGTPGTTAVRVDGKGHDIPTTIVLRFYALYQLAAVAAHVVPHERTSDLGFNSLIAIQSSAFLMTLYRKALVEKTTHGLFYSIALLISYFHIFRLHNWDPIFFGKIALVFVLRTQLRVNKYVLWIGYVLLTPEHPKDSIDVGALSAIWTRS